MTVKQAYELGYSDTVKLAQQTLNVSPELFSALYPGTGYLRAPDPVDTGAVRDTVSRLSEIPDYSYTPPKATHTFDLPLGVSDLFVPRPDTSYLEAKPNAAVQQFVMDLMSNPSPQGVTDGNPSAAAAARALSELPSFAPAPVPSKPKIQNARGDMALIHDRNSNMDRLKPTPVKAPESGPGIAQGHGGQWKSVPEPKSTTPLGATAVNRKNPAKPAPAKPAPAKPAPATPASIDYASKIRSYYDRAMSFARGHKKELAYGAGGLALTAAAAYAIKKIMDRRRRRSRDVHSDE